MMKDNNYESLWKPSSGNDISTNKYIVENINTIVDRYDTADPFVIAEKLNIDLYWINMGQRPLGDTSYDGQNPIIILNESIKHSVQRYFTLAHELGHVILHADSPGYHTGRLNRSVREHQANDFATALVGMLYIEENGRMPDNYADLVHQYGTPYN